VLLAATSGLLAGLASAAFLAGLEWATDTRIAHPALVWFLPFAGLAVGLAYHRFGGLAAEGSGLLIDEIHQPRAWVPRRMAPMVAVGAVVSHLFGASVGREGTALQMSGSLTDVVARRLSLPPRDRRTLLVASLAAGFGGMFGVPFAGAVFGLEVQAVRPTRAELLRRAGRAASARRSSADRPADDVPSEVTRVTGRLRARARDVLRRWRTFAVMVLPVVVASFTANVVVRALQHHGESLTRLTPDVDAALTVRVAVAGAVFGVASILFIAASDVVREVTARYVSWPPLRPVLGGVGVLGLVALAGRDHLGLSLPLAADALAGQDVTLWVPAAKLAFTAMSLGSGFVGGEVTPLFVIGATTGAAISPALGLDPMTGAAVGYVAVFAAAANTPIACTVMAVEVFGPGMAVPAAVACLVAFACSSHRGIYPTQRVLTSTGIRSRADAVSRRPAWGRRTTAEPS
jgi:H+/Cl- antiporter ClcA